MIQNKVTNNLEEKFIIEKKDDNKLTELVAKTRYHSLYKQSLEEERVSINLPEEALEGTGLKGPDGFVQFDAVLKPKRDYYILKFGRFLHDPSDSELNDLIYLLENANENDELEIQINSPGGYVDELVKFKTIIQTVFNGRTKTVLKTHGASCGALLFCLGNERVITEDSYIMFHNYSNGAWGKGNEIVSSVLFDEKRIDKLFKKIMVEPGYFSNEEYQEMKKGVDYWIDADDIIEKYPKLATHILISEYELTIEEYKKYKESGLTIQEFVKKEEEEAAKAIEAEIEEEKTEENEKLNTKEGKSGKIKKTKKKRVVVNSND